MKRSILFIALLFFSTVIFAQSLTGVWQGYFYSGIGPYKQYYKYEVQINNLTNNSLQGVTYSYRTTVFYGKANMQGIWFPKTKSILIKELELVDLKMEAGSEACSMTCNLAYSKADSEEILKGDFTSINVKTKKDCGSGTVYLKKVDVSKSDFGPEPFLIKKKPVTKQLIDSTVKKTTTKPPVSTYTLKKPVAKLPVEKSFTNKPVTPPVTINKNSTTQKAPVQKPATTKTVKPITVDTLAIISQKQDNIAQPKTNISDKKMVPIPEVIKSRSNPLIKRITTNSQDIEIQLYDNGDVDGDTITVYHNNEVIAWKKGLGTKPIILHITATTEDPLHEFIMVADNLGRIPPNTALMVITTGGKRYEIFIAEDNTKNAKVVVDYEP